MNIRDSKKEKEKGLRKKIRLFFEHDFWGDKINSRLIISMILSNVTNWLMFFIFLKPATENIILHYNVYFGVDLTGRRNLAFVLPAIGAVIIIINYFLARYFHKNGEKIAGYVLLTSALMAQLSLIIASFSVIIINY